MDYLAGEDHTIDRPAEYAFWRDYVPAHGPGLAGHAPELADDRPDARSGRATVTFDPTGPAAAV